MERVVLPATTESPWERNNRIPALFVRPPHEARAGIVLLHGHTMRKEDMHREISGLAQWGYAVLAPDLPLHGERAIYADGEFVYPFYGNPSGLVAAFDTAVADVRTCGAFLADELGAGAPLGLTGFSLGGCLTILSMARLPGLFKAGVSVVGAALLSRLLLASAICGDIRDDLTGLGYDSEQLAPILAPVEATEYASTVRDLLMIGADDDNIVPGRLVRETYQTFDSETNDLVMINGCGHFPPMAEVARFALPFFAARLGC